MVPCQDHDPLAYSPPPLAPHTEKPSLFSSPDLITLPPDQLTPLKNPNQPLSVGQLVTLRKHTLEGYKQPRRYLAAAVAAAGGMTMGFFCLAPGDFKRRLPRTPSTGTMSSADDLDEREPPSPSDNGGECSV